MTSKSRKSPAAESDQAPVANSPTQLEIRFADAQSKLAPRRRQMIRAILDRPEEIYFLSSRELGKRFNMDAATIVRTIQVLGYDRYADFAADLRRHFVARITPYTTMQAATREKQSVADRLRQNVDKDIANLHLLKTGLDTTQVIAVAKRIHRARRVVVIGIDLAASLAHFLAYGLAVQGFDAEAPVGSAGNLIHKIKVLDSKDLVIAISFGRCLRETVEAAQRARQQGVPTFGITDSDTTPLA
jgi:DNA-binding MurR/RpiR family transcriptional regulator